MVFYIHKNYGCYIEMILEKLKQNIIKILNLIGKFT
jgi:hypothetical protein